MLGLAALAALCGCAGWSGPRTVDISAAQLERAIDRQFPVHRELLELFDVQIAPPRVSVQPDAAALNTEFDLDLSERVTHRTWHGSVAIGHGVRYEPADRTVRLTNPRLLRIALDGVPVPLERALQRLGRQLGEQLFDDQVVYTLSDKDLQALHARGLEPARLQVSGTGLTLTLVPVPAP